jgi:flagellar hook-associated protein 2
MAIDYINALGAGASFDTKKIVEALVEAERAPARSLIQRKIDDGEAKITGLASAASVLNKFKVSTQNLNDARDFNTYSINNSQTTAFTATANSTARPGTNSITVSQVAQEQRSISNGFNASNTAINDGSAIELSLTVGGATQTVNVTNTSLEGTVAAINAADLGVRAELVNTGAASGNYQIQLIGESGANKAFSMTSSDNSLSFSNLQSATDANLTVNGINFTRSSNSINDIIGGVTLNLMSATEGAATLGVNQNNQFAKANIIDFVASYNEVRTQMKELMSSEMDGALAGDSIIRSLERNLRNAMTNQSSTPGTNVRNLTDMGISNKRYGVLELDEQKLDQALGSNYADVIEVFTANTNDQSSSSSAAAGIAGDISKLIDDMTSSQGYFTTQKNRLDQDAVKHNTQLSDLEERMEKVEDRYNRQFLAMQKIIDEMNSTKEGLISSLEYLPFTNKD